MFRSAVSPGFLIQMMPGGGSKVPMRASDSCITAVNVVEQGTAVA